MAIRTPGEGNIQGPSETIDNIHQIKNHYQDIASAYEKQFLYNEGEVGIRNEKTGSFIKLGESSDIELFSAGRSTGVYLSGQTGSTTAYGTMINLVSPELRLITEPDGVILNKHRLNPLLYQYSGIKNPKYWDSNAISIKTGRAYMDDLKLSCSVRWRCPGVPNLCGRHQEEDETHGPHWVRKSIEISPFYWQGEDEVYKQMLIDIGIPL